TGTGGVGKTRLAAETARQATVLFSGGVVYVGLASLGDAALVLPTVARSLGLKEVEDRGAREALCSLLRAKEVLLVLDNFEHLLGAAPDVAALIEGCPDLTVLVTSRAPLRVRGEQEYPVQPLALPASTRNPSAEEVSGSPSGGLFVDRAQAASPAFEVTGENAGSVAALCWRLDGIPLALELAAARVKFLDPASLVSRLDRALSAGWARDLPERQRTMQAALDWSHDLLGQEEKVLFRRLSVFAGGFTLEAAEAVGAADDLEAEEVLGTLGTLVEQSLVVVEPATEPGAAGPRYRMLEPVRQYAREKLRGSGEENETRGQHTDHYLELMEEAGLGLKGPDQGLWVRRLTTELDNVRAAIEWATGNGRVERIAEASWDSWTFWWSSGNIKEGRRRMEDALAAEPDLPTLTRAKLRFVAATLGQAVGDFESAWAMNEESREVFEEVGFQRGVGDALGTGGLIALGLGRPEEGFALMQKSVDLDLEVGNEWGAAAMLGFSATVPFAQGDLDRARQLAERGLDLARKVGARDILYVTLHPLAAIALAEGEHERAKRLFEESAGLSLEVGEKVNTAFCLDGLATVAAAAGELGHAARLWGAAEAILEDNEVISYPFAPDPSLRERRVAEAKAGFDERAWKQAWAEGRAMSSDEAVAYALGDDETSPPDPGTL
ncbi:MAG: ATP-binding protein, partial [Rubrobacter sp.]